MLATPSGSELKYTKKNNWGALTAFVMLALLKVKEIFQVEREDHKVDENGA